MARPGGEQEDYGERFADFWTSKQPNWEQREPVRKPALASDKDFRLWDYPNPELLDLNVPLLDEQQDLFFGEYPCDHVRKVAQFPELLQDPEDVFSQDDMLQLEKMISSKEGAAQEQPMMAAVAGAGTECHQESSCTSDCGVLMNTICNLSKVLLAHYSSPASPSVGELQLALFNLSKCLLHAHGTVSAEEDDQLAPEKNSCSLRKDDYESASSGLDEAEDNDIVARLQVLMGLQEAQKAAKGSGSFPVADDSDVDETSVDETKSAQQQEEGSYLDFDQVEQRLATLKSRAALAKDKEAEAAIVSGEQIDEQHIVDRKLPSECILFELDDAAAPAAAAAAAAVEEVLNSDSEESGWEHL